MGAKGSMKRFEEIVFAIIFFAILFGFFLMLNHFIPLPGLEKMKNSRVAKDLIMISEPGNCDSAYLGAWDVENFGNIELFCENGQYFGEIPEYFSLSMSELPQKGIFLAVFCYYDTCYSHPITIEGDSLHDVYNEYVSAER